MKKALFITILLIFGFSQLSDFQSIEAFSPEVDSQSKVDTLLADSIDEDFLEKLIDEKVKLIVYSDNYIASHNISIEGEWAFVITSIKFSDIDLNEDSLVFIEV